MRTTLANTATAGSATVWCSLLLAWRLSSRWWPSRCRSGEGKMGCLIRDVLDNQLLDRHQRQMGKVDGLILELRPGQPPRLAYIEVGSITLARRLHPRLARWVALFARKLGLGE